MLTERRIRDAKPGPKLQILWDKQIRGLGLRITPKGVKSYILLYRINGRERRATLAREAQISLKDVRVLAAEKLNGVREGNDPLERKKEELAAPTVKDGIERFFNEFAPQKLKGGEYAPKTIAEYRKQSNRYIEPSLGRLKISDVKRSDVVKMADSIKAPVQRNRVLALTSKLFRLFEYWELRPQHSNPTYGIERNKEEARDRVLSEEELAALLKALHTFKRKNSVAAIRILMYTGLRVSEVLGMKFEHINWETKRLLLPKTKTGKRETDLPDEALEVLSEIPRLSEYCFSTRQGKPTSYKSIYRHFNEVMDTAGIEGATPHDLRRSYMTHAAASGVGVIVMRDLLGHKDSKVAERYARELSKPLREARQNMGSFMDSLGKIEEGS